MPKLSSQPCHSEPSHSDVDILIPALGRCMHNIVSRYVEENLQKARVFASLSENMMLLAQSELSKARADKEEGHLTK